VRDERVEVRRVTFPDPRRRRARGDDVIVIELPARIDILDAAGVQEQAERVLQNSPRSPAVGRIGSVWNAARCV
jgi:hypothetical protein